MKVDLKSLGSVPLPPAELFSQFKREEKTHKVKLSKSMDRRCIKGGTLKVGPAELAWIEMFDGAASVAPIAPPVPDPGAEPSILVEVLQGCFYHDRGYFRTQLLPGVLAFVPESAAKGLLTSVNPMDNKPMGACVRILDAKLADLLRRDDKLRLAAQTLMVDARRLGETLHVEEAVALATENEKRRQADRKPVRVKLLVRTTIEKPNGVWENAGPGVVEVTTGCARALLARRQDERLATGDWNPAAGQPVAEPVPEASKL